MGTKKKGVKDREGHYDVDGVSMDDDCDVIVASESLEQIKEKSQDSGDSSRENPNSTSRSKDSKK